MKLLPRRFIEDDVLTLARDRVRVGFDMSDTVSVMFSGGKDSTATLNLVLDEAAARNYGPVDVVFFDEEAIPLQTVEYVRRVAQRPNVSLRWYCIPVKHRNACSRRSPWWYPFDPDNEALWVRPLPENAVTEIEGFPLQPARARLSMPETNGLLYNPAVHGRVSMFMGIRAQESLTRLRAVSRRLEENYIVPYNDTTSRGNIMKVYPIYDWRTEDVWTAPAQLEWDYNHAYDVMEAAGVPQSLQRCSPAYGEEPLQKLWTYAVCFPEIWDRMTERVPGAATAGRYALTELYSYGARPVKPDDVSWMEFLAHYITKFPAKEARGVAQRVRWEIENHYAKTRDPILTSTHPATGVSWDYLLMLAMRGDFKMRKQHGGKLATGKEDEIRERYNAAYAEWQRLLDADAAGK